MSNVTLLLSKSKTCIYIIYNNNSNVITVNYVQCSYIVYILDDSIILI